MTDKIKLTFTNEALAGAKAMRKVRGIETPEDFEGPEFIGNLAIEIEDRFVLIDTDTTDPRAPAYFYNIDCIARIKVEEVDE